MGRLNFKKFQISDLLKNDYFRGKHNEGDSRDFYVNPEIRPEYELRIFPIIVCPASKRTN